MRKMIHPLRKYLDSRNISVAEFAKTIGVTRQTVYDYLSFRKNPSPRVAGKIVGQTDGNISLNALFNIPMHKSTG